MDVLDLDLDLDPCRHAWATATTARPPSRHAARLAAEDTAALTAAAYPCPRCGARPLEAQPRWRRADGGYAPVLRCLACGATVPY